MLLTKELKKTIMNSESCNIKLKYNELELRQFGINYRTDITINDDGIKSHVNDGIESFLFDISQDRLKCIIDTLKISDAFIFDVRVRDFTSQLLYNNELININIFILVKSGKKYKEFIIDNRVLSSNNTFYIKFKQEYDVYKYCNKLFKEGII